MTKLYCGMYEAEKTTMKIEIGRDNYSSANYPKRDKEINSTPTNPRSNAIVSQTYIHYRKEVREDRHGHSDFGCEGPRERIS